MKRVGYLKRKRGTAKQGKAVRSAVAKLKRRGYKPHPYSQTIVRVSIGGRYFVYSATTDKWSTVYKSGMHRWYASVGIDDFISQAKRINIWAKEQAAMRKKHQDVNFFMRQNCRHMWK